MHIEDENAAAFEAGEPELTAVVSEPAMMRLISSLDGRAADDFAVGGRARFYIDGDKFIGTIAHTFDAERPDIDKLLLSVDAGEIRRRTGLIGTQNTCIESEKERADNDGQRNFDDV